MYENYRREDIENHIHKIGFHPLDVMVTGATGAGKSSTLNSFFDKVVAKVGEGVDPETMELSAYSLTDQMRFWDTPGLGDGIQRDVAHAKKITDLLLRTHHERFYFLDMAVIIVEAGTRDIGTTLNQADFAMKGRHWDARHNCPDAVLKAYLEERADSLKRRIYESTGIRLCRPVYYSARYRYHIDKLYDLIIDHMPDSPRKISA